LSDLLTPWNEIEARLEAAAKADFVIAIYNPVSARRTIQLRRARDILLGHRPPSTPVVIARNLGRPGETTRLSNLEALDVGDIDMLTVLIVGAGSTRAISRPDGGFWVYTPRGYERKAAVGRAKPKAGTGG
jgi:cobalt-precorrin 5A hydrolase/precorrin-3B C17-methyltransferase